MTIKERFRGEISLGAIIQICVLIVGLAVSWSVMDARSQHNAEAIDQVREQIEKLPGEIDGKTIRLEERVRGLENTATRADERSANLIALLSKLDSRLERIESALQNRGSGLQ